MDENCPIDIHYNKLLDWLIDRRHCDSKWHAQSKSVRSLVSKALSDLPKENSEIAKILKDSGEELNYFESKKVLEVLKKVDGENTTLFGQYAAPRVKEWAEIVKAYEQKKAYLAGSGQQLARLVNYEVPAFKHQLGRCQQTIRECSRREGELKVHAAALMDSYHSACANMGIKGSSVATELAQLTAGLPDIYQQLLDDLPSILPAIKYYRDFLRATREDSTPNEEHFLPMLHFVLKNGNVTVYQWKHGEPCSLSEPKKPETDTSNMIVSELDIDWGVEENAAAVISLEDGGIDFGGIDFGEGEEVVDLGISVEDCGITIEGRGEEGEVGGRDCVEQKVEEAVKETAAELQEGDTELLLENTPTKNLFLDDLHELREFIKRRSLEVASESISLIQMGSMDEFGVVESGLHEMLCHVKKILDHLTNERVQHLFLIKGSKRYLQRLTEKLSQDLKLSNRAISQMLEMVAKRELATASMEQLQPQYTQLVDRTRTLQTLMSGEISKLYNGRRVNIMGEINQIT